ncbi:hypothetical protein [Jatrophihabitans fulvus]
MGDENPKHGVTLPHAAGDDIAPAVTGMLEDLYLLGSTTEMTEARARGLQSPAQSVAVIEAGATALAKWWATAGAALVGGVWTWAGTHWPADHATQRTIIWSLGLLSAALVLAMAHLISSDVRARATASVATITARAAVANRMVAASGLAIHQSVVPLAKPIPMNNIKAPTGDQEDWLAVAIRPESDGDTVAFLVQKQQRHQWVKEGEVSVR